MHTYTADATYSNTLSPITILDTKAQWLVFLAFCLCIFAINLTLQYLHYNTLDSKTPITIRGQVIAQYPKISPKTNSTYQVLKIRTESGAVFYTTSKEAIKNLLHMHLRIYGKPAQCSFWQYLQSCFITSFSRYRKAIW